MSAACFNVEPLWLFACSRSLCCLFQVQTKQWGCNRKGITCNCGVIIRIHNDLISFNCCNPPKLHRDNFTPIRVDIPRKKCLAPGIVMTQLIKGFNSKYEVFPCCFIFFYVQWHWVQPKVLWKCVHVCMQSCRLTEINSVLFTDCMSRNGGQRNGARPGKPGIMATRHSKAIYGRNKTKWNRTSSGLPGPIPMKVSSAISVSCFFFFFFFIFW